VHKSNQQLQIREKKMRTKYWVLGCIAAVGVAVISSPAKATLEHNALTNNALTNNALTNNALTNNALTNNALTNNALTNNAASPNSQVPQNTMPNATGITLTSPGYTSLQVEGGHLVGIK
jgi:hypothetical protein